MPNAQMFIWWTIIFHNLLLTTLPICLADVCFWKPHLMCQLKRVSQFILKIMPDLLQFTHFLWQLVSHVCYHSLSASLWLVHQRKEWAHSSEMGPRGEKKGTNGALMKISSLLINVEIYTRHAHGQGRETRLNASTHTDTQAPKNRWFCHITSLLSFPFISSLFCHLILFFLHSNSKESKL